MATMEAGMAASRTERGSRAPMLTETWTLVARLRLRSLASAWPKSVRFCSVSWTRPEEPGSSLRAPLVSAPSDPCCRSAPLVALPGSGAFSAVPLVPVPGSGAFSAKPLVPLPGSGAFSAAPLPFGAGLSAAPLGERSLPPCSAAPLPVLGSDCEGDSVWALPLPARSFVSPLPAPPPAGSVLLPGVLCAPCGCVGEVRSSVPFCCTCALACPAHSSNPTAVEANSADLIMIVSPAPEFSTRKQNHPGSGRFLLRRSEAIHLITDGLIASAQEAEEMQKNDDDDRHAGKPQDDVAKHVRFLL